MIKKRMLGPFLYFFIPVFCLLYPVSCNSARVVERIVARVNGEAIFQTELDANLRIARDQMREGLKPSGWTKEMKRRVIDQMVEEKILLQEAEKEEIVIAEEELRTALQNLKDRFPNKEEFDREMRVQGLTLGRLKEDLKKQLMILHLIERKVKKKIQVTNKEVREYCIQHEENIGKDAEEEKEKIRRLIFDKKFNRAFEKWVKKLKKKSVIKIKL